MRKYIAIKMLIKRERQLNRELRALDNFDNAESLKECLRGQIDTIEHVMNGFTQSKFEREIDKWIAQNKPPFVIEFGANSAYLSGVELIKSALYSDVK